MLGKSIGFALFESKPESDSIKLTIRDRLVDGELIKGRFLGKQWVLFHIQQMIPKKYLIL